MIGTEVKLHDNLLLGTIIGLTNTAKNPLRLGVSLIIPLEKMEALAVHQYGPKSSYFYIARLVYLGEKSSFGLRTQCFLNTCLYADYNIADRVQIWRQSGFDLEFENFSTCLGLRANL